MNKVLHVDAKEGLSQLSDKSITGVITDPPYGLNNYSDVKDILRAWLNEEDYKAKGSGFMQKSWDAIVVQPNMWKEVYRVLKPGGFAFVFAGTRSMDLMALSLRLAGFEYRDTMMFLFGSGFPKSHDISKAIDSKAGAEREVVGVNQSALRPNRKGREYVGGGESGGFYEDNGATITAPATPESQQWDGYGTALKPSYEPILIFMKPLNGTFAGNAVEHGVAGLNIEEGRIAGGMDDTPKSWAKKGAGGKAGANGFAGQFSQNMKDAYARGDIKMPTGRWPANIALTHHPECEYVGEKEIKSGPWGRGNSESNTKGVYHSSDKRWIDNSAYWDEDGKETVEDWNCHPECPIRILDEQVGNRSSGKLEPYHKRGENRNVYGEYKGTEQTQSFGGDSGSVSRFFYTSKAPKKERNMGCEDLYWKRDKNSDTGFVQITKEEYDALPEKDRIQGNPHPTVKPVGIMRWLVKMLTMPEETLIIDPFAGSGTTGVACALEEVEFLGFDSGKEYVTIANSRINYAKSFPESFHDKKQSKTSTKRQPTAKKEDTKGGPPSIADW